MLLVLASFSERRALHLERPVPTAGGEASGAARQAASAARGGGRRSNRGKVKVSVIFVTHSECGCPRRGQRSCPLQAAPIGAQALTRSGDYS